MINNPTKAGNVTYKADKPQVDIVLDYLKQHGSMDEFQAKELGININSFRTTISRLREKHNIKPDHYERKASTFSHNKKSVCRYRL